MKPFQSWASPVAAAARTGAAARFWVYVASAAVAVTISYYLGKENMWDTLDYHFYAGFSALHDRFGTDYFAAGTQSYLNPYVYAPFYALARSGLPALWVASILAIAQSAILWLSYELAVAVSSSDQAGTRVLVGVCAALLALANPILINQLGSSYADVTTAEVVLAGWLLLIRAVRAPNSRLVLSSGLLLGLAAGLKLTNSVHALSACVLLLFLPGSRSGRLRFALGFGATLVIGFMVVAAPWSIQLQHQFGNPLFPLLNGVFHSPEFSTVSALDSRFVPASVVAALWRPFAMAAPMTMVDDEYASPDLRYVLLLVLVAVAVVRWGRRRLHRVSDPVAPAGHADGRRALIALGCAFLVDWALWLRVSGDGRYFLAMACIAGILTVALAFRLLGARPKTLGYLLGAVFAVQGLQVALGATYRHYVAWDGGPWFEVSVPRALAVEPDLYFLVGEQSNSFIDPFLPRGSGFVNLDGNYVLGPDGANGARIESLIRKYSPHLRVAALDDSFRSEGDRLPDRMHVEDTLALFGLRVDTTDCSTIAVHDVRTRWRNVLPGTLPIRLPQIKTGMIRVPESSTVYVVTCRVVRDPTIRSALTEAERGPNLVLDRLEDACPQLFRPRRPLTEVYGSERTGYRWIRKYPTTNLAAVIVGGSVELVDGVRGGQPGYLGGESAWEQAPLPLTCGRSGDFYYAKLLPRAQ